MNNIQKQKEIHRNVLEETEAETKYDQASKKDLADELRNSSLGEEIENTANSPKEKPSLWVRFKERMKRFLFYI
jgi:hypothetical protein